MWFYHLVFLGTVGVGFSNGRAAPLLYFTDFGSQCGARVELVVVVEASCAKGGKVFANLRLLCT